MRDFDLTFDELAALEGESSVSVGSSTGLLSLSPVSKSGLELALQHTRDVPPQPLALVTSLPNTKNVKIVRLKPTSSVGYVREVVTEPLGAYVRQPNKGAPQGRRLVVELVETRSKQNDATHKGILKGGYDLKHQLSLKRRLLKRPRGKIVDSP